jgi:hypothetical protein
MAYITGDGIGSIHALADGQVVSFEYDPKVMSFDQWWNENESTYSASALHMSEYHMARLVWDAAQGKFNE